MDRRRVRRNHSAAIQGCFHGLRAQINALTAASTLTLTKFDSIGTGSGAINFSYSAADSAFDFLAAGDTLTITYHVTVADSNQASAIMEGDPSILERLGSISDAVIGIPLVVVGELMYMAYRSRQVHHNLARSNEFLKTVRIYRPDEDTASVYGDLKAAIFNRFGPRERAARRRATLAQLGFDENDLWIAATALQHNLTVVSADSDFPRIAEVRPLTVESWLTPSS